MNNQSYLIPANSKKSLMIFGFFNYFDLILFGSGIGVTMLLLLIFDTTDIGMAILVLLPALVTGMLVFPIPNYHNILTILINIYNFFFTRQRFIWKGWCVKDEQTTKK